MKSCLFKHFLQSQVFSRKRSMYSVQKLLRFFATYAGDAYNTTKGHFDE